MARVLDVARFDDGTPYLVMEHLDGSDLAEQLLTRGPLPIEEAVELVVQACDAIAEAHTLGIVHRDLKPANLFVIKGRDGRPKVKVLDFGISKTTESLSGEAALTRTRAVMGSPDYMSPEQFNAPKTIDARTDIWSIGATLFELLTGQTPFPGNEVLQIAYKILNEPTPRIEALRTLPPGLSLVIQRCLEKDRAARYQSVAELVAALAPFRARAPSTRITHDVHASALAATVYAQPAPVAPVAWEAAPTVRPFVASSIPAPALKARHAFGVIVGFAAIAGVLLTLAVGAVAARAPAPAVASQPSAEPSSAAPVTEASSVAPVAEPSAAPSPVVSAAPAPTFRGTHAVTRVTWVLGGVVYKGIVHTNGATGYVDIHTVEPGEGPVVIREDLELQRGARGWSYVASNPRYADDGERANFIPNVFYLEQSSNGAWTFVETCAIGTGICTRLQSGS